MRTVCYEIPPRYATCRRGHHATVNRLDVNGKPHDMEIYDKAVPEVGVLGTWPCYLVVACFPHDMHTYAVRMSLWWLPGSFQTVAVVNPDVLYFVHRRVLERLDICKQSVHVDVGSHMSYLATLTSLSTPVIPSENRVGLSLLASNNICRLSVELYRYLAQPQ